MKPRVVVVTRNIPPLVGGMERLIWHLIDELRPSYRVHVVGPSGCGSKLPGDVHVTEIPIKPLFLFLLRAELAVVKMALRIRPTIVLAGSGLTAPITLSAARLTGAASMVYLHGLDIKADHFVYRSLWKPVFRYFDSVLVNSRFTRQLAIDAKIPSERITVLHPGVELPETRNFGKKRTDFRAHHNLLNRPLMLSVGRITSRKGLLPFVNDIMPQILAEVPSAELVIVGDDPADALLTTVNERLRVKQALEKENLASKVHWLGKCSQEKLDQAYFSSDVLVFPVQQRSNDIEGFGMVAMEAAAHGLPVVAFSVGGVTDAVADNSCGNLIPDGDSAAFARAVIKILKKQLTRKQIESCRKFAELFRWELFGNKLRDICRDVER